MRIVERYVERESKRERVGVGMTWWKETRSAVAAAVHSVPATKESRSLSGGFGDGGGGRILKRGVRRGVALAW